MIAPQQFTYIYALLEENPPDKEQLSRLLKLLYLCAPLDATNQLINQLSSDCENEEDFIPTMSENIAKGILPSLAVFIMLLPDELIIVFFDMLKSLGKELYYDHEFQLFFDPD